MTAEPEGKVDVKSNYAPINGINMYYELCGAGDPLVLIHGGGSTIETSWGQMRPHLSQHYLTIAMDLQGHGRTKARPAEGPAVHDAEDVCRLLEYLSIPAAHIFGFSKGGNAAMELAVRHPSIIHGHRLIIAAIGCRRSGAVPGFWEGFDTATLDVMPKSLKDAFLALNDNDHAALQRMQDLDVQGMLAIEDWSDEKLRSIAADKSLVFTSFKDIFTPEHALFMARTIPNAELVILPGTHGAFLGDLAAGNDEGSRMPEMAAEVVHEFLSK